MISPGLLKRCSLYRRNEQKIPEKCWDAHANPDLPKSCKLHCPNNTMRESPRTAPSESYYFSEEGKAKLARILAERVQRKDYGDFALPTPEPAEKPTEPETDGEFDQVRENERG